VQVLGIQYFKKIVVDEVVILDFQIIEPSGQCYQALSIMWYIFRASGKY